MRQLRALAWKEWREARWVWSFAMVVFIALPLIGGIEGRRMSHRVVFEAFPFVRYLGGVLAIVVGATSVCRDLNAPVAEFWRSRAVTVWRWMGIKYGLGLIVVEIACILPLAIEEYASDFRSSHTASLLIAWIPFVWAAQYSLGFVCACLMPRPTQAVMLALAMSLLAYCLPIILPPLSALYLPDVFRLSGVETHRHVPWDPWPVYFWPARQLPFVAATLAMTAFTLIAALVSISRDWRIESGQRLIYWSIAFVFLLLFASASFQLATNLPLLQAVDLSPSGNTIAIYSDGRRGVVLTDLEQKGRSWIPEQARAFEINAQGIQLGPAIRRHQGTFPDNHTSHAWLPGHPNVLFSLLWTGIHTDHAELSLIILNLSNPGHAATTVALGSISSRTPVYDPQPVLLAVGDSLYASWCPDWLESKGVLVDVHDVNHPRVSPAPPFFPQVSVAMDGVAYLQLPPVRGLPPRELLDPTVVAAESAMQGDVLVLQKEGRRSFLSFELTKVSRASVTSAPSEPSTDRSNDLLPKYYAEFRPAGRYEPTLLEQLLGFRIEQIAGGNGYISLSQHDQTFGSALSNVTIFDVSDPVRPQAVGHFAAPEDGPLAICPVPGGRLLAGGHKLYLLGPPPRK